MPAPSPSRPAPSLAASGSPRSTPSRSGGAFAADAPILDHEPPETLDLWRKGLASEAARRAKVVRLPSPRELRRAERDRRLVALTSRPEEPQDVAGALARLRGEPVEVVHWRLRPAVLHAAAEEAQAILSVPPANPPRDALRSRAREREAAILQLRADGLTCAQIGVDLGIGRNAVIGLLGRARRRASA